jgi:hypothetical protein
MRAVWEPEVYVDQISEGFVKMVLGLDIQQLVTHYLGFALSGIHGMYICILCYNIHPPIIDGSGLNINWQIKLKNLKDFCISKILMGLRKYSFILYSWVPFTCI